MTIGERIREKRKQKGMTQAELAKAVQVNQSMITQIERGTKSLSVGLGIELARALDCTLEELAKAQEKAS